MWRNTAECRKGLANLKHLGSPARKIAGSRTWADRFDGRNSCAKACRSASAGRLQRQPTCRQISRAACKCTTPMFDDCEPRTPDLGDITRLMKRSIRRLPNRSLLFQTRNSSRGGTVSFECWDTIYAALFKQFRSPSDVLQVSMRGENIKGRYSPDHRRGSDSGGKRLGPTVSPC